MGARIESVATARSRGGVFGRGGLRLSDAAARACLHQAHRGAEQLDVLVNAGLYKEHSLAEPALASIIQEDIGANPHRARDRRHGTFSFDVMNGGCGVLTAAQLVDAFVGAGTAELGLIVAADADPSPRTSRRFPFSAVGGAMLLQHTNDDAGFRAFDFRTFPEHADLFVVRLEFDAKRERNILDVRADPAFASRSVECATTTVTAFLDRSGLGVRDIDLLVTSQYPPRFGDDLARALGVAPDRLPRVAPNRASAHTAGPIVALEAAVESGQLSRAHRVLFVTAGAGITIGTALYACN